MAATGAAKVRRLGNFSDDGSRKDPVLDHETFYLILLSANSSAGPVEFMSQEAGRLLQNGFLIFLYIEMDHGMSWFLADRGNCWRLDLLKMQHYVEFNPLFLWLKCCVLCHSIG